MSENGVWPGRPFPLGATWDGGGTNFALFSEHASGVELCLFDDEDNETRIPMTQRTALNWHCYLPGIEPGQRYGFRVHGPYAPLEGHRFNPCKLLLDPYAKSIEGVVDWAHDANVLPYVPTGEEDADLEPDDEDDAAAMPKSVVIDDAFIWEGDRPPRVPFADTVIYETHVKGFTMLPPRGPRGPPRHVRGARLRAGDRVPAPPRGDRRRAPARPPHLRRVVPGREGTYQLLGLQHDRLPLATLRVRRHRAPRRAGSRVQGDGQGDASRWHRGDPRRGLQPHRRGQPPRPDAVVQGRRQPRLLPGHA